MAVRVPEQERVRPGYFGVEYEGLERIAPEAEDLDVPNNHLIMLSQIRAELSTDLDSLKQSIRTQGLIHPVSVARMTGERLGGYIEFVNELWNSDHRFEGFQAAADGYFYLVIAGHTRTSAINRMAEEERRLFAVPSKVYSDMTDQAIIAHQLEENIHSQPSSERQAMAIVESYYFGKRKGLWDNKAEFLASSENKFSRYALNQALTFADLPADIRDFVFAGTFPYILGVELGRAMKTAKTYFGEKYEGSEQEEREDAVQIWMQTLIARIHEKKLGGSAARNFIKANATALEDSLAEQQAKGNMSLFKMELDDERKAIRSELGELLRHLGELPMRQHARAISLHLRAFPGEEGEELRQSLIRNGSSYLGGIGVQATAAGAEPTLSLVHG